MVTISDFNPVNGSEVGLDTSLYCQIVSTDPITKDNVLILINGIEVEFDLDLVSADTWTLSYPTYIDPVLWGGQTYTVKIQVTIAGVETKASYWFTTTPNVLVRDYYTDYKRSMKTQALANSLPIYSYATANEYSMFQQFANPMALRLEHFMKEVSMHVNGLQIQTGDLHSLNLMHRYVMEEDFHKTHIAVGTTSFITPLIKGTIDITAFDVFLARKNSLNSLYYEEVPTRFNGVLVQSTFNNTLMVSTYVDELPVIAFPTIPSPGKLYVETQGGTMYFQQSGPAPTIFKVTLKGKDAVGTEQKESLSFLRDEIQPTNFEWSELTEVSYVGDFNIGCQITIYWQRPEGTVIRDPLMLYTEPGRETNLYWDIETADNVTCLLEKILDIKDVREILRENPAEITKRKYALADIYGDPVALSDFTIDHNWIYAIDNEYLYIYPKLRESPIATKKLSPTGDVDYSIMISGDYNTNPGIGDKVDIEIEHVRATKVPGQFRLYVEKPDGTTEDLAPWTVNTKANSYVYNFPEYEYTFTQYGAHVFTCEVVYTDRSVEKTQQLMNVELRSAIAQYDLRTVWGVNTDTKRLFRATDQELYIVSGFNIYRLDMYKDKMLISYNSKEIYFMEKYDGIEVDLNGQL